MLSALRDALAFPHPTVKAYPCAPSAFGRFLVIFSYSSFFYSVGSLGFILAWCLLGNKGLSKTFAFLTLRLGTG